MRMKRARSSVRNAPRRDAGTSRRSAPCTSKNSRRDAQSVSRENSRFGRDRTLSLRPRKPLMTEPSARTQATEEIGDCQSRRGELPSLGFGERIDQLPRLQFRRVEYDGLAGLPELVDVIPLDVLILDVEDPGFLPLAERTELDLADNGLERCIAHVVGELALVDAADSLYCASQDLHFRVREG